MSQYDGLDYLVETMEKKAFLGMGNSVTGYGGPLVRAMPMWGLAGGTAIGAGIGGYTDGWRGAGIGALAGGGLGMGAGFLGRGQLRHINGGLLDDDLAAQADKIKRDSAAYYSKPLRGSVLNENETKMEQRKKIFQTWKDSNWIDAKISSGVELSPDEVAQLDWMKRWVNS